jgi:hypothetical protein
VPDWKALFPDYTVRIDPQPVDVGYDFNNGVRSVTIDAPTAQFASANYSFSTTDFGETVFESSNGDAFMYDSVAVVIRDRYATLRQQPEWAGYYYGFAEASGTLAAGPNSVQVTWYEYVSLADAVVGIPVIRWDAESVDQWTWPDPTLHGLLPEITTNTELLETFGASARWTREVPLDWTDSGSGSGLGFTRPGAGLVRGLKPRAPLAHRMLAPRRR